MQIRLDKYLADMGVGTRSEVKQYIRKKQVQVNGSCPSGASQKVDTKKDRVLFQGLEIQYTEKEYYMLHKPQGCVSAVTDARHKTVLDYITGSRRKDLFPVGRLDIDTEGLLLVTNDGALSHHLLSPGRHVPKTYYAKVSGEVGAGDAARFLEGLDIGEDKPALPARLDILSKSPLHGEGREGSWVSEVEVTVVEGKFHQVKRMFEAVGKKVLYLKRVSMGSLALDGTLKPGEYRALTENEVQGLWQGPYMHP
ncbi:MAG: rRNA pseudouridine synthase [Lachnospiraceae bacterium]|jgi:16S rRNA pseudouridine516 synthase|nr:rRNA pseudouridine synthase [Lachnospiraceae bacterium]